MKKTIMAIAILATMLVVLLGTSVNAAKVETNVSKVEAGKRVEVTVSTDAAVEAISFNLVYPEGFKYVETKSTLTNGTPNPDYAPNTVRVSLADANAANATKTVTVVFEAEKDAKEAKDLEFKVTNLINSAREELTSDVAKVEIVKVEDTTTPENPGDKDPVKPTDPSKDKDTNGKPIGGTEGKLPQAGVPVFAGAIAVIIVAGAALVIRNRK